MPSVFLVHLNPWPQCQIEILPDTALPFVRERYPQNLPPKWTAGDRVTRFSTDKLIGETWNGDKMFGSARPVIVLMFLLLCPVTLHWTASSSIAANNIIVEDDDEKKKTPTVKNLKRLIRQAYMSGDDAGLRRILLRFARLNSREPVRAVLSIAAKFGANGQQQGWYWDLLEGAAAFNRPLACSEMGDFIVQYRKNPISRDLLHALQKNRGKYVTRVIKRVLEGGTQDLKLMALDMASQIHIRRTVDILMPIYKMLDAGGKNRELKERLVLTLVALTRQNMGDSYPNWSGWWSVAREKGLKIIRLEALKQKSTTGIARIKSARDEDIFQLELIPPGRVLVIEGPIAKNGYNTNNDDISGVLTRLRIPHDTVLKERLEEKKYKIDKYAAIFINCTQIHKFCQSPGHTGGKAVGNRMNRCLGPNPHDVAEYIIKDPGMAKLKKWVKRGGHLFTEDWVLKEVLAPTWPKYVAVGNVLTETTVDIRAASGQTTHRLLRGVFVPPLQLEDFYPEDEDEDDPWAEEDDEQTGDVENYDPTVEDDGTDVKKRGGTGVAKDPEPEGEEGDFEAPKLETVSHEWKIDNESNAVDVKSKKVKVIIRSSDLKKQAGKSDGVALTFHEGRGRVLHVLSHFGKQSSRHNEATIENLLLNFLIEVKIQVAVPEEDDDSDEG